MLKEIKLYKSIEDYCKSELHSKVYGNYDASVWIVSVCPYCGQEQIIRWDWCQEWPCFYHYFSYYNSIKDRTEREKAKKEHYEKREQEDHNKKIIKEKIIEEIDDYLKNHFICCSCSADLSTKPGYFYCSSNGFGSLFINGDELPIGFKKGNAIEERMYFDGYTEGSLYKKLAFTDKGNRVLYGGHTINDMVYNMNAISTDFYEKYYSDSNDKCSVFDDSLASVFVLKDGAPVEKHLSVEQILDMLKYYREFDGIYADQVMALINTENDRFDNSLEVDPIKQELSTNTIKDILKEVIGFETSLLSLETRLKRLYLIKERENSKYLNITTDNEKNRIVQLENEINELSQKRSSLETDTPDINFYIEKIAKDKPKISYPIEPNRPIEPQYETPGFFNKKKVEAANSEKKQKYDADLASYNVALSEYNRLLSDAQKMEKEQNEEIRQEAMILAQEYRKKELSDIESKISECQSGIESAKSEISKKEIEIQAVKDNLSELPWNKEYDQAVDLLKKTLEAKIVYEKSEVIFPKYHDLVAYSQFYEYFQSGRCTSLTGPDGAYNLYENELRQNIIIGKLDDISNSLEEIKQNQYMIYSELKSINSNISKLDDSMNKILGKVTEIGTNVEAIRNSTEIMEENSRIAAYYTKKNAELTNALGYLVALK